MKTTFLRSVAQPGAFPDLGMAECAFVGRSNVGKSSLLNVLVGARVARTSRTPGRTQTINLFEVEGRYGKFSLADLPGYGFAKAPKDVRVAWLELCESYLESRQALQVALLLFDLRRDVEDEDREIYAWLGSNLAERNGTVLVVATKADKLSKAQQKPALAAIGKAFGAPRERVFLTSADLPATLPPLREALDAHLFPPPSHTY